MRSESRHPAPRNGFALLLVLWTMVLLSLIGVHLASTGRTETQLAANVRDEAVTQAAADGAVQDAAFHLLITPPGSWVPGGTERAIDMPRVAVVIRVESEEGHINPNLASTELLGAIMRQVGTDTQTAASIASAIVAWRFPGATVDGPEVREYQAAGLEYGPPSAPFRSLDELAAVRGMTPQLLAQVKPFLSVFATGDPDPSDAAPEVVAAIRAATGRVPQETRGGGVPAVVRVMTVATGPNRTRFTRRAVLALNRRAAEPVRVLSWDAPGV